MDLSQFPMEVLEALAGFLSVSDLSACSSVSHSWRNAFNLDLFWRPHCNEPQVARYLSTDPGLVRPRLDLSRYDALPPVCEWRAHHMRRAHLLGHWAKGRYHTDELRFETSKVVNCTIGMDNGGRHWLAVNLADRTEIWNIQTTPTFHAVVGNITSGPSYLGIVGDKLIIIDFSCFVQAFHLQLSATGFAPSENFFYTASEPGFIDLADGGEKETVYNRVQSSFQKGHSVLPMDNLLIGYSSFIQSPGEHFLHVWNVETVKKLCQESMLDALGPKTTAVSASAYVSVDPQTKRLLCSLYLIDKYVSKLVIYDLKCRKFTKFSLTITGKVNWCSVSDGFVVISHLLNKLHVYSLGSGSLINTLDTNTSPAEYGLQNLVLGSYVVLPSKDSVRVVNAWCHWDSMLLHFRTVFRVTTVSSKLLVMSARPYAAGSKVFFEVWNVEDKVRLFDCPVADCDRPAFHSIQPMLTKTAILLEDSVRVLSFW